MFYVKNISTDASTSKADAKETRIRVWGGVLHYIGIRFPDGCGGLLHVQVRQADQPVMPTNASADIADDGWLVEAKFHYKMQAGTNLIRILTWNDDTALAHSCRVRIGILPEYILTPYRPLERMSGSLRVLLKRIGVIT